MFKPDQSEQAKSDGKYVLCSDVYPTLSSNLSRNLGAHHRIWRQMMCFCEEGPQWKRFRVFFCGMPRVLVFFLFLPPVISTWRLTRHMTPLPHPGREWGKKADMLEGNVLVKKYRGGRQEEFMKKGFALLWDLPVIWFEELDIVFLTLSFNFLNFWLLIILRWNLF